MSVLQTKAESILEIVAIELVLTSGGYKVLCTCRVRVSGTVADNIVIPVNIDQDLKLHVDMFAAAVLEKLTKGEANEA